LTQSLIKLPLGFTTRHYVCVTLTTRLRAKNFEARRPIVENVAFAAKVVFAAQGDG
jgi:hypothetical protein